MSKEANLRVRVRVGVDFVRECGWVKVTDSDGIEIGGRIGDENIK